MKLVTKFLAAGLVLGMATTAFAADHQDGDLVKNDPSTDINDVFAFPNGNNVVLAMTLFPLADKTTSKFSQAAYYVFHTQSHSDFNTAPTGSVDVICKFDNNQKITCWVGTEDIVSGDASKEVGITSADGKVKAFAGVRADPFFFYLTGFKTARAAALTALGGGSLYPSGCPKLDATLVAQLHSALTTATQSSNDFVNANVLGITLEIDKSLLTANPDEVISVWASTNGTK